MRPGSRPSVSALLVLVMALAQEAAAAPVVQDEAGLSPKSLDVRADPAAGDGLGLALPGTTPATDASPPGAAPAGRQQPASAPDTQATHPQRPSEVRPAVLPAARAQPAPQAASAGGEADGEIDPDLKEAAKAALQWAHEARDALLPAHQADPESESAAGSAPHRAGAEPTVVAPLSAEPGADIAATLPQAAAAGRPIGGELNLIQEAIALVKTIAGHPLTWLVALLVAFGSAAAGVVRYRVHAERRWGHRRAGQRRRESLAPIRGRRQTKPTGTEGLARRERSPAKAAPRRPVVRRASKPQRPA